MKVIPFSVPKTSREAFRIQVDALPYLYDKLHQHPETQIIFIEKGEGTLIAGDYVGRFSDESLFLVGSNQPHVFRSDDVYYKSKSKLRVNAISRYFDERYAGESFWQLDELQKVYKFLLQSGVGYRIQGKTQSQIIALIREMVSLKGINKLIHFMQLLNVLSESKELIPLSVAQVHTNLTLNEGKRTLSDDVCQPGSTLGCARRARRRGQDRFYRTLGQRLCCCGQTTDSASRTALNWYSICTNQ